MNVGFDYMRIRMCAVMNMRINMFAAALNTMCRVSEYVYTRIAIREHLRRNMHGYTDMWLYGCIQNKTYKYILMNFERNAI